ncbi:MAG: hypothetical protein JHD33_04655 [Chthoniobacterales bacterium]|jgi:uncharacterized membrane protein HdeD (DUF308 family)|nr:hypothetical protein [Chthoniobacterales bacterium]
MGAVEATVKPDAADADYAQFAQRNLDKLSWLYPLVNNKLGALLHLQLRHDQLFFMKSGQVVDEIGYGDDGKRFHERDMGKVMRTPQDITAQGYWFVEPRFNAKAAYEALQEVQDGAYYSLFSNQCQDWADRVRLKTEQIEKEQHLAPPSGREADSALYREVAPTVPAAWYFGMIAVIVGVLGLGAPLVTGFHYLKLVALLLFAIGLSDLVYAFSSRAWGTFLSTVFFGLLSMAGGVAVWVSDHFLLANSNGVMAVALAAVGFARIGVAVRSRPFSAWIGTFVTGFLLLATAWIAWIHKEGSAAAWVLGAALSVSFISAGISTIWLNRQLENKQLD